MARGRGDLALGGLAFPLLTPATLLLLEGPQRWLVSGGVSEEMSYYVAFTAVRVPLTAALGVLVAAGQVTVLPEARPRAWRLAIGAAVGAGISTLIWLPSTLVVLEDSDAGPDPVAEHHRGRACALVPVLLPMEHPGRPGVEPAGRTIGYRRTSNPPMTGPRSKLNSTLPGLAAAATLVGLFVSGHSGAARAQEPAAAEPAFEVVSIKPNDAGDGRVMIGLQPGRFSAVNVTPRDLIRQAYRVQDFQIVDAPEWLAAERFDVQGTLPRDDPGGQPPPERVSAMVRRMLADRFGLVLHRDTRELPVYALVTARDDGTLGPNMTPAKTDCEAQRGRRSGGPPGPPPQLGERIDCGMMMGPGTLNAGGMQIADLARSLSQSLGRVVLEETGLDGRYDFQLRYATQFTNVAFGGPPAGAEAVRVEVDQNLPELPTAIEEQLGLKLDARRGPVEVLVIDRAERPEPN